MNPIVRPGQAASVKIRDLKKHCADTPSGNGKSAYELALAGGFSGSIEAWLLSLKGSDGLSAYELAKQQGFGGSLEEWLQSLHGRNGEPGGQGDKGADGKSAYQIALENGFQGTETEWLASLKGDKGEPGAAGTATSPASPTAAGTAGFKVYNGRNPLQDLLVPGNYLIYSPAVLKEMGAPGYAAGILTVNSTDSRNIVVWEWVCPFYGRTGFRVYQNNRWLPWESASYRNINASAAVPRTMIVTTGSSTAVDLYQGNTLQSGLASAQGLNIYAPQNGYEAFTTGMSGQVAEYTLMINGGLTPEITFPGGEIPEHGGKVSVQVALPGASQVDVVNGKAYFLSNGRKGTIVGVPSNPIWTSTDNVRETTPVFADQPYEGRIESWSGFENCIQIIAVGKNDINHGKTAAETIPIIEKITKCFKRERFVICTLWSNYDYDDGKREEIRKLNEWIRKKYGRFVYDLERFVLSDEAFAETGISKTPDDTAAVAKGVMPKSVSKDGGKHMAPAVAWKAVRNIVDMIKSAGIV
ncbi:collagen-like protein [Neisseria weixii]|uniref:collagen-like triple helix repeat-containing protein n=1 Tax=Neisseria weixii TaxID=1853276 RepID=UPI0036109A0E